MKRVFMLTLVCSVFLLSFCPVSSFADTAAKIVTYSASDSRSGLKKSFTQVDPGPTPAASRDEIERYIGGGSSNVYGRAEIIFKDNEVIPGMRARMQLFPDTPYLRWRIAKWGYSLDRRQGLYSILDWFGTGLGPLPSFYALTSKEHVVRRVYADDQGLYRFLNVPAGDYILTMQVQLTSDYHYQTQNVVAQIPYAEGVLPVYQSQDAEGTDYFDGWVERTGIFTVKENSNTMVRSDVFTAMARFYGSYGG